jgi:glycosyltransferase involved in cell wall biosynthesis
MLRNILITTTQVPFTKGGAELHVEGLRRALCAAGYNAEIVALPFKWYPPAEIMRSAMAWRMLDLSAANGRPVDLVIGMKFPAYLVAHPLKVLWILHQHRSAYNLWGTPFDDLSTYPEGVRIREWIKYCDEHFIPEARKVFANSRTVAERLQHYNHIDSEPLYHPPPLADRLQPGETGDYIFYPSRLESQKRQELLIEAMRLVQTPVKLILAGGSADPRHYEALVKQNKVGDRVTLRGFVTDDELLQLYANSLGVSYVPFDEDYGYVTLEGMLSAKPVIVTDDSGGAAELIEHGESGLVVEAEPKAIAAAFDEVYSDRDRARQMGEHGREKLKAMDLSWSHVVKKIISAAA